MSVCHHHRRAHRRAFSLMELVIVVVIIGIVGAIAVPRLGEASSRSTDAAVVANLAILNKAAEFYSAEHAGKTIAREPGGSLSTPAAAAQRLTGTTTVGGAFSGATVFGPYLRAVPVNPYTRKNTIRLAALNSTVAVGAGWVFDETTNSFAADRDNKPPVVGGGKGALDPGGGVVDGGGLEAVELD